MAMRRHRQAPRWPACHLGRRAGARAATSSLSVSHSTAGAAKYQYDGKNDASLSISTDACFHCRRDAAYVARHIETR